MNFRSRTSCRGPRRRGVTLLELVISTAISSMLFIGMASAISLATSAIPSGKSLSTVTMSTQLVLERLSSELQYATTLTKATSSILEFTVADRDGVAPNPEKIKYTWAGTGSPLLRQYNNGSAVAVMDSAQSVQFTLETTTGSSGTVVTAVRCFLQATSDTRTRLATNVRLLNRPAPPPP
jgi:Tfp pilus assembly protein FimT